MKKLLFIFLFFFAFSCRAEIVTDSIYINSSVLQNIFKETDKSVKLKRVTRVLTLATFSYEIGWYSFIDDPAKGFEINYTKQKMSRMLSKGISVGLQPVSKIQQNLLIEGDQVLVKARNQIIHGHLTLRFSPFKFSKIQPYIDLIGGAQGSLFTSTRENLSQEDGIIRERVYFDKSWLYGYSVGVRVKIADHFFFDLRYARVTSSGNLENIAFYEIKNDGSVSYTPNPNGWEAPNGYMRAGVSISY